MGKILVIAEKPSLGRSIAGAISWWKGEKFERQGKDRNTWLESDNYIVVSLVGHLYELIDFDAYFPGYDPAVKQPWDLKKLPFFPDDWKFKFEGKEKVQGLIKVANQQMNRKDVDAIYNAGDPDREGQRLVDEVLLYGLKAPKTIYRLWLPDTTNKTIKQAFETAKPNAGYVSLSSSAETRSEMDWLLGIELTRYVSIKAGGFTRIGRCVCPIVQHIIEREKAIKEFVPKPYSAVSSKEKTNGEEIELTSKRTFKEGYETEAQALADAFNKAGATVTDIKTERKTVNPGKLFSMSDLQSFACKADKTLSPADVLAATQALYEGGYVTYPRTNSSYLATNETVKVDAAIRGLAQNGITGLVNKPKLKSIYDDSKIEAHSAITPTGKWPASLTGTQKTVFDCILNRFCAVFCEEACTVDRTTIVIHCNDEDFTLKGDVQVTPGWRKFEKPTSGDKLLPKLNKGDAVNINFKTVGKMTTPPKRYTVEALNNWMVAPMRGAEKANEEYSDEEWKEILSDATICTEATRADTVDRCVKSNYISLKKGVYYGEAEGFRLVDTMEKLGIDLDVPVTVNLSKQLHSIKDGTLTRIDVLEFTKKTIEDIMAKDVAIESAQTGHGNLPVLCRCPRCGNDVVETQKTFSCIGKDKDGNRCPVTLWKNNKFFESIGKKLTKTTAAALLTKGKAPLKGCVSKKTGKKYDCILTCDCSKGRPEFHLEFDHSGASGTVVGKCPFCGSDVAEGSKGYDCTNKDCSAVLWKNSKLYGNDVKISATAAKALLANKAVSAKIKNKDKTADVNVKVGIEPHEMPNGKKYINLKVLSYEK